MSYFGDQNDHPYLGLPNVSINYLSILLSLLWNVYVMGFQLCTPEIKSLDWIYNCKYQVF